MTPTEGNKKLPLRSYRVQRQRERLTAPKSRVKSGLVDWEVTVTSGARLLGGWWHKQADGSGRGTGSGGHGDGARLLPRLLEGKGRGKVGEVRERGVQWRT